MSDKEWYEGLTVDDFSGLHLQVCMINGVVYSGLVLADDVLVAMDLCGESRPILERESAASQWRKSPGVESVSLVWDERDWEQLELTDYDKTDAIVVNGHLLMARADPQKERFCASWRTVPFFAVSCALRRKYKLPTKPGTYRAFDGTLLILLEIKLPTKWMYVSKDFTESGIFIGDEQVEDYLPLVPVHFVNGRA